MNHFFATAILALGACQGAPSEVLVPLDVRGQTTRVTAGEEQVGEIDVYDVRAWDVVDGVALELAVEPTPSGARIHRVSPRPTYVLYRDAWFVTLQEELDLSRVLLTSGFGEPVPVTLAVANAAPWADDHLLQFYSLDTGLWFLTPLPEVSTGETSLRQEINWAAPWLGGLSELWVAQMEPRVIGADAYSAVTRVMSVTGIEMYEGDDEITGSLEPAPVRSFDVDWSIRSFDDVRLREQAVIATSWYDANIAVLYRGDVHGFYGLAADLVTMRVTDQAGRDIEGRFDYGNPFPDDWHSIATFVAWYPVAVRAREGDVPATVFDSLWVRDSTSRLDGQRISPRISAPRDIVVADAGGVAPRVSWSPPEMGEATSYEISVVSLRSSEGRTDVISEVVVRTALTEIRLPPGTLDDGAEAFVVRIAALEGPLDHDRAPLTRSLPYAFASLTSDVIER